MVAMLRLVVVAVLALASLGVASTQADSCAEQRIAYTQITEAGANSVPIAEFEAARDSLVACMGVGPVVPPTPTIAAAF